MSATPVSTSDHVHTSVPRLALSPDEAAEALSCSRSFFDEVILPELRFVRRGRRVFVPVTELQKWLEHSASRALEGLP